MRVLIIGGGIGGLCLAQGLRRSGIDAQVYERNIDAATPLSGYGIHLNRHGCEALETCLPPENWSRFDAMAGHAGDGIRFHDEQMHLLAQRQFDSSLRSIGRIALRDILLPGIEHAAHPGKEFVHYEKTNDGRVRAHFTDGSQAIGDLLVGADASNSRVRKQYLPKLERTDVGALNIAGRYTLSPARIAELPDSLTDGRLNNIVPLTQDWMFASAWQIKKSAPAGSHTVGDEHYVVWAYAAAASTYPADITQLTSEQLRDLILARIEQWAPSLQKIVRDCDPDSTALVKLRGMPHLEPWVPSNITLLGDAIHSMTPMAGIGANTALRDALVLRNALIEVIEGKTHLIDAVAGYECRMREYANQAVALSTRNASNATSGSPLKRRWFRQALRAAQVSPLIKRLLFSNNTEAKG